MSKNKNINIIKNNMTDEEKKYKEAKNKCDRDRYNNMTDEEKQKHKKNIKTYQKSKNKKEIIKSNIQKI